MRARDLALAALALAACANNPDPRSLDADKLAHEPFGSWIVVRTTDHLELSGELLAIDPDRLWYLPAGSANLHWVKTAAITGADLFEYEAGGFGAWGLLGTLSTISHGFVLVFSAPIWILTATIADVSESGHMILHYPDAGWDAFSRWARFPQGLPPRLQARPPGPPPPAP
jgi:hypothetical protein